jgi:hypothetical protein
MPPSLKGEVILSDIDAGNRLNKLYFLPNDFKNFIKKK